MSERRPAGLHAARARWGLVIVLTAAPFQAAANESTRLAGSVVNGSGAAVPGAAVLLRNAETGFERLAQADGRGQFDFRGLSPGRTG